MFELKPEGDSKSEIWRGLVLAVDAVTAGELDPVANMANAAAVIFEWLPDLNWAGFYRLIDGELVLGPFQGKAACIRIAMGAGVCGKAASERAVQCVPDVDAFPGHIACDSASRSELVAPLIAGGTLIGVLDLDSPTVARFNVEDATGLEAVAALIARRLAPERDSS